MQFPLNLIRRPSTLYFISGVFLFTFSIFRIHLRLKTTLLGYEIGRIKQKEITLRDRQSELKMLHAKVSTLKHLNLMSQTRDEDRIIGGKVAQK
jgi:hypothetical protein